MEQINQNIIADQLKDLGLTDEEIQSRLLKWKMAVKTCGSYNPLCDSYDIPLPNISDDMVQPDPSNLPSLKNPEYDPHKRIGMFVIKSANETIREAHLRPDPISLFKGLWYEGELCCLFADSFIGKSLYAVQMGTSISAKQIVLYFDFELSDKMFQLRYTSDSGELYEFPDTFFRVSVDPNQLNVGDDFESLVIRNIEETALEMNAKCIVIDNLTWICQASEKGEVAAALMKDLWGMTRKHGWSILILSHTPKRNLSSPITQNDLSGSKRLFNFFDGCFAIGKSARDENERYVKQLKVRSGLLEYHADNVLLCRIEKNGAFTEFKHIGFASEKEMLKESESEDDRILRDAIYELADKGMSYQAIAEQLGTNKTKVCRVLKRRRK